MYEAGAFLAASRWHWQRLYGRLPWGMHLRSLCGRRDCVSPYHHVIRSPLHAMERFGGRAQTLTLVRRLLAETCHRNPDMRIVWEGPLASLEADPPAIHTVAGWVPGITPLMVLCGYASLAIKADRSNETGREKKISQTALLEDRLLARLASLDVENPFEER